MKRLFIFLIVLIPFSSVIAQFPEKMSYQAVVRNSNNQLVSSQTVGMRISILQGSVTGTAVYEETQTPTTNTNGLVTIEIGGGTVISGTFSIIDWANGPYYIKTETDPTGGINYTVTGTSQLLSVPYALHAKTAENITGNIAETDPVFNASPAYEISSFNIDNWNTAYGWGNHSGLYRMASWVPSWADVTSKPSFATIATSGSYNDLTNKPTLFSGAFANLTGKPTTLSGYGITDADGSVTNEIQTLTLNSDQLSISGGNTVTFTNWDKDYSNDVRNVGDITIDGHKTFVGTITVPTPVNETDAVTKAYVDALKAGISSHYIGESFGGGIVFYVYDNGQHGLIAGTGDLSGGIQWYAGTYTTTNAFRNGICAGLFNTERIIASQGVWPDNAAKICSFYQGGNFGDWYLPSLYELSLLYLQKDIVGGFSDGDYWSSNDNNNSYVWYVSFLNGEQHLYAKSTLLKVRAIRTF
jgi:hypothetical protein